MSLISRVQNILLKPKEEWRVIDAEPATVQGIFTSYVMILAAIGPIAGFVGSALIGFYGFKVPIPMALASAVLAYILQLVAVYVTALIIDALAPSFGATKDSVRAFKVAAYAATPYWIACIAQIFPLLGWLAWIGALYGWYLLYLGLGTVMKSPQDKSIVYTIVTVVVEIILTVVFAMIVGMIVLSVFGAAMMAAPAVVHY
jgi:uncharacterized membrane protein